ncbi:beta strand repeat-containing protein [Lichenicoccus sp.]|uniref:beta strand repeat-containing protein n=1 Tax=Lichenicoccus sp. TaxID=2781899 RepID=UPI003D113F75
MTSFIFSTSDSTNNTLGGVYGTDGTQAGTVPIGKYQTGPYASDILATGPVFQGRAFYLESDYAGSGAAYTNLVSTDGTAAGTRSVLALAYSENPTPTGVWDVNGILMAAGTASGLVAPGPVTPGLWASKDGSSFTLVASGITASDIVVSNGVGYFAALRADGSSAGLWRTDGTAHGTASITPTGSSLNPVNFTAASNGLTIFTDQGSQGPTGPETNSTLWVTDGTQAGTHAIVNAALGTNLWTEAGAVSVGGRAIFAAVNASGLYSVWSTDGTASGTVDIFDEGLAYAPTRPITGLAAWGDKLVIETGYGLYVTDNTGADVTQIAPWAATYPSEASEEPDFVALGNKLILASPGAGQDGSEIPSLLYVSDGTTTGSAELALPSLRSIIGALTVVGHQVVFEGIDTSGRTAFFVTDGTASGSRELSLPAGVALDPVHPALLEALANSDSSVVTLGGGAQFYNAAAGAIVQPGSGSDTITANAGGVSVLGSAGQLTFFGGTAPSSVAGGTGADTIFGGAGGGTYTGGSAGHNILISQGTNGAVTHLTGSGGFDQIFGSATGEDVLTAGPGRDSLIGGGGPTTITGGAAASVIFAGAGPTSVVGGSAGGDIVVGGSGALSVTARSGDAIFGGAGGLTVSGSLKGADSIVGGDGPLSVAGRGGNMLVVAGTGTSNVSTGNGASLVFAGAGNLSLVGGAGSMQVVAGAGHATIIEGTGPTTLEAVRGAAGGADVISGFRPSLDRVALFGYSPAQQTVQTQGGSTVISLADGTRITLLGVSDPGHAIIG